MNCINPNSPEYEEILKEIGNPLTANEIYRERYLKNGVEELFDSTPELANVGTPEQYSQYLDTIFPDSKVKDIVYHGSKSKNEVLNNGFDKSKVRKDKESGKSLFEFTTSKIYAEQQGSVIPVLLNETSNNIQEQAILSNGAKAIVYDDHFIVDNTISKGDIQFGISKKEMQERGIYHTVFEPEQIHILGNKQNIEGFENFIINPPKKRIEGKEELLKIARNNFSEEEASIIENQLNGDENFTDISNFTC